MRTRLTLLAAATAASALALTSAGAAPTAPQVIDPAGDANFVNGQNSANGGPADGQSLPVGNQAYADVLSVAWAPVTTTTKVKKKLVTKVTGFTVTTTLAAPPTPPSGTSLVYRMLGRPGDDTQFVGPVYYTSKSSDPSIPQSALRDNLSGVTRLTPIALPVIKDATITWTVPISAFPKELKPGTTLTNLFFEVRTLQDFRGQQVPAGVPSLGGAYGLAYGLADEGTSEGTFKVG